ncbi:hypothetical protein BGZ61DRAFT_152941 [Ilyonectria robusta]|uniref:uncharacterized protein n=1 Tax=Ilyonectria robusta TaxID=1079257 RepID=UPI001E8D63B8|nr:uncharacterized protein BGZ61DRAFT_152941 [Ilyonectria robusta]KAH8661014.1 hypothetical protein BGZ61DRAFT_152941 [Ilyonectria robusta]
MARRTRARVLGAVRSGGGGRRERDREKASGKVRIRMRGKRRVPWPTRACSSVRTQQQSEVKQSSRRREHASEAARVAWGGRGRRKVGAERDDGEKAGIQCGTVRRRWSSSPFPVLLLPRESPSLCSGLMQATTGKTARMTLTRTSRSYVDTR